MIKVCHLRGTENYWLNNGTPYENKLIKVWEKIRGFSFLEYRKKIRDIVIKSIIDSNEFDIICYNDKDLKKTLGELSDSEIIGIHCQDDDDLYLGGVLNDTLSLGTYISQYTRISSTAILREIKKQNNQTGEITLTLDSFKCKKIYGSGNILLIDKLKNLNQLLYSIANRSFFTRGRIKEFIHKQQDLPIKMVDKSISIEIKTFLSLTFYKHMHMYTSSLIYNKQEEYIDNIIYSCFINEYMTLQKLNLPNIPHWENIKKVWEQFYLQIK